MPKPWTRPADVRESVRKKWPVLLSAFVTGQEWAQLAITVRGPGPAEIGERLGEVQDWAAEWQKAGRGPLRVEYKKVGGRHIGANMIPCRAWVDGYEQAWALLGARAQVLRLIELGGSAKRAGCERLIAWLESHPVKALALADEWDHLVLTVRWIDERQVPGMYLRQVDVPGVDTKFIGRHKGVLAELLDLQLDPARVDASAGDFETRYGFLRKPAYVRYRSFAGSGGFTELTVRAEEFSSPPAGTSHVYIVENEISYLAFPLVADAIVIFGGGYAIDVLESLSWLASLDVVYWGDIDTHGFAILNRLRRRFPHTRSMLMDRATLLAHRDQWVAEQSATSAELGLLSSDELELYRDLVIDAYGQAVRLEQERIRFSAVEEAISGLADLN
ncbi:MAG TPA: Wadjet anti-phage system protein JetD domain-containing protein [Trebonia sp.]